MSVDRRRMSRNRILETAVEILDVGVYGDLTVDALARALHMSKSTLYKYFASKDDVVVCLIDAACDESDAALAALDLDAGTARSALDRVVKVLAEHADRVPRAAVLQQSRLPPASQDRIAVSRSRIGDALQRVVERGVRAGELRFQEASLAATSFMAGADAAMRASARGEVALVRGASVRALLALYLPGLTTVSSVDA